MPRSRITTILLWLTFFSIQQIFAQDIEKEWDAWFGSNDHDALSALKQTSDGGYILGGNSSSGISGHKTQASQGGQDYWVVKVSSTGTKEWDLTLGGSGTETLTSLQQTSDGGYIIGGYSDSGISGNRTQDTRGSEDFWVVKIDNSGVKEWDARFGGNSGDRLTSLQQTTDGGYILGGHSWSGANGDKTESNYGFMDLADYWVVKIDNSGIKLWDVRFGGNSSDHLRSIKQTTDGGYILGGESISPISGDKSQGSKGGYDYWIIKINSLGVKEWEAVLGGSGDDFLYALQQTSDGGYILGGYSVSGIGGDKTQDGRGMYDYWIVKVSSSGIKEWDARFGGNNHDYFSDMHQTSDGGYILGGYSISGVNGDKTTAQTGSYDYWVIKITSSGEKEWDTGFGGFNPDRLFAVQQTADDGYILGGYGVQNTGGGWDYWIVKLGNQAPLPVNLVHFSAESRKSTSVRLKWQTAQEVNAMHYDLERSKDMHTFDQIARLPAAGNPNQTSTYTFTDESPLKGRSYYRLVQVDQDGKSTTYRTISVRTSGGDLPYPNPSKGGAFQIETANAAGLKLLTGTGVEVPFSARKIGDEAVEITPKERLQAGVYLISSDGVGYKVVVE